MAELQKHCSEHVRKNVCILMPGTTEHNLININNNSMSPGLYCNQNTRLPLEVSLLRVSMLVLVDNNTNMTKNSNPVCKTGHSNKLSCI